MKGPGLPAMLGSLFAVVVFVLVAIGPPGARPIHPAPVAPPPPPPSITAGGFTLVSASIELPEDPSHFEGPHAELLESRCTACHSASMVQVQPPMNAEKWTGIVKKMRETYGAQLDDADAATIVTSLAAPTPAAAGHP